MSQSGIGCPVRRQIRAVAPQTLSSKRQENRLAFLTAGLALWPAWVTVRRRVRVGSTEAGSLGWHLHLEHPNSATSHGGAFTHLRQSGGNGRDRHSAHLGQRAGMWCTRRAPDTPASTAASIVSSNTNAIDGGPCGHTADARVRPETGHPARGLLSEQTMEWHMHKRLRPRSVPPFSSKLSGRPQQRARKFLLERIWLFLLLWRLIPHQQPPCAA